MKTQIKWRLFLQSTVPQIPVNIGAPMVQPPLSPGVLGFLEWLFTPTMESTVTNSYKAESFNPTRGGVCELIACMEPLKEDEIAIFDFSDKDAPGNTTEFPYGPWYLSVNGIPQPKMLFVLTNGTPRGKYSVWKFDKNRKTYVLVGQVDSLWFDPETNSCLSGKPSDNTSAIHIVDLIGLKEHITNILADPATS